MLKGIFLWSTTKPIIILFAQTFNNYVTYKSIYLLLHCELCTCIFPFSFSISFQNPSLSRIFTNWESKLIIIPPSLSYTRSQSNPLSLTLNEVCSSSLRYNFSSTVYFISEPTRTTSIKIKNNYAIIFIIKFSCSIQAWIEIKTPTEKQGGGGRASWQQKRNC